MTNIEKKEFISHALRVGAYSGIIICIVIFITETITKQLYMGGILTYIIMSLGIMFGQHAWQILSNNQTSFLQLSLHGIVCGLGATIIAALYIVIDIKFVHIDALDTIITQSIETMREMNIFSDNDIENTENIIDIIKVPITITSYIIYNLTLSIMFSIFSAWLSKIQKK